ncbi:MAG: biotin--[acetyl-CoA-carboxylase] ligase [Hydrogenovibrio sp.]
MDAQIINESLLRKQLASRCQFVYLDKVDSTNLYLKKRLADGMLDSPIMVLARLQTDGYGQQGRNWVHEEGSLAFSIAVPLRFNPLNKPYISPQIALLLRDALTRAHGEAELLEVKWPNDVYFNGRKLAGILIELQKDAKTNALYMIVGVGVNTVPIHCELFRSSFISGLDKHRFLVQFAQNLFDQFSHGVVPSFDARSWSCFDYFKSNELVSVINNQCLVRGRYMGLDAMARAMIEVDGELNYFDSGAISIKRFTRDDLC